MIDTFRPADTRCGHPATITPEQAAPDHRLGYYLSTAVRQVIRDLGVVPHGPRGDELLTSIVTSALHYLDRDGAL
jgi:hypothetical protein